MGADTGRLITNILTSVDAAVSALRLTLYEPPTVGVPEITPVVWFTLSPGGNPVALSTALDLSEVMV